MKQIALGVTKVPQLGQGTWLMGDDPGKRTQEIAALRRGIELGMRLIDTAEMYGDGRSESLVGEAIRPMRDQVYLVSKVLPSNASAKGTIAACERSLRHLGIETLDLYLLHWMGRYPLQETVKAFETLQQQGKIRAWGVSNLDVAALEHLAGVPDGTHCVTDQILYNPEYRGVEFDLLPWCAQQAMAVMAYSPVGQGGNLLRSAVLRRIAEEHHATPAQVALAWCLRHPLIAIPKAGSVQHVEENVAALDLRLTSHDLQAIDAAYPPPGRKERLAML